MTFLEMAKYAVMFILLASISFFVTWKLLPAFKHVQKDVLLEIRPFEDMVNELSACLHYRKNGGVAPKVSCEEIVRQVRIRTKFHKPEFYQSFQKSVFEIYQVAYEYILYVKRDCKKTDIDFDLVTFNYYPLEKKLLPADRQKFGFESLDFSFTDSGLKAGSFCVALKKIPYGTPEKIITGRYDAQKGFLWHVTIR